MQELDVPRFRLTTSLTLSSQQPQSFATVMRNRRYVHYGQGQMEDLHDRIDELESLNVALMTAMMARGVMSPEDIATVVNGTSGYNIEVVPNDAA